MTTTTPRERGILFSALMVRAILAGTKTQTRRAVNVTTRTPGLAACLLPADPAWTRPAVAAELCPHGRPGDRLWVREAWRMPADLDAYSGSHVSAMCIEAGYQKPWAPIQYEADGTRDNWQHTGTPPHEGPPQPGRYRHARFMPRWASRLTLAITDVRVERLQSISEADAAAEGCQPEEWRVENDREELIDWPLKDTDCPYRNGYALLWDQINGAGSWKSNPWVWVVEFRQVVQ